MSDPNRHAAFLQEMGLGPIWLKREAALPVHEHEAASLSSWENSPNVAPVTAFTESVVDAGNAAVIEIGDMDWEQLNAAVSVCTRCNLCKTRTKTVFGTGDRKAKWLFIGEGPGRNEDLQGLPFVGPAGKLLDNMMRAMGMRRGENTYIANVVKCRPTDAAKRDRPPESEEVNACMPYLERQIALIQPSVIVALGKTAALSLLKMDASTPVARLRGKVHRLGHIPLIVTYHPAYLLRSLADKSKTWADLCLAMQAYDSSD